MILTAVKRNHNLIATASVMGLNLAAAYLLLVMFGGNFAPASVMGMFMVDPFSLLYQLVILIAALACSTLSHAYIETYKDNREELYILMLCSVAGAMLMVSSSHYASFFISLELMSIPVYGLLAYTHQRSQSFRSGCEVLGIVSNCISNVAYGYGIHLCIHRFIVVL